jgi:hypothetical protein
MYLLLVLLLLIELLHNGPAEAMLLNGAAARFC